VGFLLKERNDKIENIRQKEVPLKDIRKLKTL